MLPGFRFLFATVVLAVSVLVFGLGAAALLRAAHEEFASLPSWRLAQQPLLAPQFEMSAPTLAMLRIEAPAPRSMAETTRPQSPYLNAMIPDPPRNRPETGPVEASTPANAAAPKDEAAPVQAEQRPPAPTPPAEAVANLNAPAGIDAPVSPPAEASTPEIRPAGTSATETNETDSIQSEPQQPEPKAAAAISSATEASEPPASEAIPPAMRSSEATASDTIPQPVVKKATRPSARSAARRRLAIARARAARQRAIIQQPYAPDPLSQIFGGSGGGNVPRPPSG